MRLARSGGMGQSTSAAAVPSSPGATGPKSVQCDDRERAVSRAIVPVQEDKSAASTLSNGDHARATGQPVRVYWCRCLAWGPPCNQRCFPKTKAVPCSL
jgi:hypothetical protein